MAWGPPSYQRVHDVSLSNENLEALLKRCSLDPAILQEKPSKKLLYYVHRQFFLELPFENLSVLRENWISLDVNDIINKICGPPRRGGYCFELNKLLASILQHLGFHVQPLASRVFLDDGQTPRLPTPPVQTHMCLLVAPELGGETFLCDVAFGKVGLLEPLSLNMLNKGAVKNGHARMKLISSTRRQMSGLDNEAACCRPQTYKASTTRFTPCGTPPPTPRPTGYGDTRFFRCRTAICWTSFH